MAKKSTKKTAKKTSKKSAKKTTKKTAKPSAKKVSKKVVKKPAKTAKKTTKKVTKKVAKKTTKKTTKKTVKKVAKKSPSKSTKKTTKKVAKTTTKKVTKKKVTKKTTKKPAAKKTAKKTTKKSASKKAPTKKAAEPKKAETTKPAPTKTADSKTTDSKPASKPKPRARNRKKSPETYAPPSRPLLLGPGSKLVGGPLISSEKRSDADDKPTKVSKRTKSPFTPKQLDNYRLILLQKRAELVGDVQHLEDEALRSNSGETQTANNAAEFGTESFEQGLNLDLAAADRNLIREIDEALQRISDRTYGLCIETHEPINPERLEELPWAKHSIDTARRLDQNYHR